MQKKVKVGWVVGGVAGLTGLCLLIYNATKSKAALARSINLKAGWNQVTYTGPSQKFSAAFKSIETYLINRYYWSGLYNRWEPCFPDSFAEPNMLLNLDVSRDCTWTF